MEFENKSYYGKFGALIYDCSVTTEQLSQWYEVEGKTIIEIAKIIGASKWNTTSLLRKRGFTIDSKRRRNKRTKKNPVLELVTIGQLINWYVNEHKSVELISRELKIHQRKIREVLVENGIEIRTKVKDKNSKDYFIQTVNCGNCGKETKKKRYQLKNFKIHYCSMECHNIAMGKEKRGEKNPRYNREEVVCTQCGIGIKMIKYRIKRVKIGNFCSQKCLTTWQSEHQVGEAHHNWKGGYGKYYGDNWRLQRKAAWKRDNYTCQKCGITKEEKGKNPDVHHITPFRLFGVERYLEANDLSNLICLCNKCHKLVEEYGMDVEIIT